MPSDPNYLVISYIKIEGVCWRCLTKTTAVFWTVLQTSTPADEDQTKASTSPNSWSITLYHAMNTFRYPLSCGPTSVYEEQNRNENFRAIGLASIYRKNLELLLKSTYKHTDNNKEFNSSLRVYQEQISNQFSFKTGWKGVGVIYLVFSQAFDAVLHYILVGKL